MTLVDLIPLGRPFHNLTEPVREAPAHPQLRAPDRIRCAGAPARDQPMRIYLPDGEVRVMTLSEYREFLRSSEREDGTTDEREE